MNNIISEIKQSNNIVLLCHKNPDGDAIGSVILISKDSGTKMSDIEKKVVQSAASFLGSQMEL